MFRIYLSGSKVPDWLICQKFSTKENSSPDENGMISYTFGKLVFRRTCIVLFERGYYLIRPLFCFGSDKPMIEFDGKNITF